MADDLRRTVHAQQVFDFVEVFALKFSMLSFGTAPKRKLKLSEPEGSTDGGRKARQSILLAAHPEDGSTRPIVCGWIDLPRKVSELRSFNYVRQQVEARGQKTLDVSREEYDRALQELTGFFKIQQIETTVVEAPPPPAVREDRAPVQQQGAPIGAMMAMLAIGVLIGFGLGYLVFGLRVFGSSS